MACHYTDNNFIRQILIASLARLNPMRGVKGAQS
jgi:hypothetical protein